MASRRYPAAVTTPRIITLALVAALAGCSVTATPAASPTPCHTNLFGSGCGQPVTAATSVAPVLVDAIDQQICALNKPLATIDDIVAQGVTIKRIAGLAKDAANFDIRFHAYMLGDRYTLAYAARNGDNALSTHLQLMTTSIELATACVKAGWMD